VSSSRRSTPPHLDAGFQHAFLKFRRDFNTVLSRGATNPIPSLFPVADQPVHRRCTFDPGAHRGSNLLKFNRGFKKRGSLKFNRRTRVERLVRGGGSVVLVHRLRHAHR
jgi:hypothetical protein